MSQYGIMVFIPFHVVSIPPVLMSSWMAGETYPFPVLNTGWWLPAATGLSDVFTRDPWDLENVHTTYLLGDGIYDKPLLIIHHSQGLCQLGEVIVSY